jgi:hypothetical protein
VALTVRATLASTAVAIFTWRGGGEFSITAVAD